MVGHGAAGLSAALAAAETARARGIAARITVVERAPPHECGGNCTCTTCHVAVLDGAESLSPTEPPEDERLDATPLRTDASRLACQALLTGGPVRVRVLFDETGFDPYPA